MTLLPAGDLLDGYRPADGCYDELVDGPVLRNHWAPVARALHRLGPTELGDRSAEARRLLRADGVTYNVASGTGTVARQWTLDPLPVVVAADEWAAIEAGLAQRARLLDLVLNDVYGPRRLLGDGLIPPEVVYGHPNFLRECDQIRLPDDNQLFHAAFDVGRYEDGAWAVLADRTQAPSGIGYALENRVVASRVLPDLYREADVLRLAPYFRELRSALERVAPPTDGPPRIVVLTPGPWSETAYEHGALATYLGYPLVQGTDLRVRGGKVWMRSLGRPEPVHVILRRVDAASCDPLELLPHSTLGVPGLLDACRTGSVSVVNTLGSGVVENPGLIPFLPRVARVLLDEDLLLPSVTSWWCGAPRSLDHVLVNLDRLVLKTSIPSPTTVFGWDLSVAEKEALAERIRARPHAWTAQEAVSLATTPTFAQGALQPRRSVLRGFVVAGQNGYSVMPGGLTRVAPARDTLQISNQNGAWSKDTWVLSREPQRLSGFLLQTSGADAVVEPESYMSQRAAENLFWMSRYAERAEDLVRLLRVASDRLTEFASGSNPAGDASVEVLLESLTHTTGSFPGFVGSEGGANRVDPAPEIRALLVDAERTGSVAHSARRLLDAAAQVRDQLSPDTWLVIGHLDRDLAGLDHDLPVSAVTAELGRVMAAMLALSGLSTESMVRDDGWQFMDAGRRIERGLQLCALLAATVATRRDGPVENLLIESMLSASESIVTYRRRYRSHAQVETLLDLMVIDVSNPRSLAYQLRQLSDAVAAMPPPEVGRQSDIDAAIDELALLVTMADTNQLAQVDEGETGQRLRLWTFLGEVSASLSKLGELIDRAHFSHQLPQRTVVFSQSLGPLISRPEERRR